MKDDLELKRENPELYRIAREKGTEAPFLGKYVHTEDKSMYVCAVCGALLFSSDTKFESGSGWPSFTHPTLRDAVVLHEEEFTHNTFRTEVRCAKCDAHLGHVFKDGPIVQGEHLDRYCINSISLELKKDD